MAPPAPKRQRAGAALTLIGLVLVVLAAAFVALAVVTQRPPPAEPPRPAPAPPPAPPVVDPGWDLIAQQRLAAAPMLALPASAVQPQPLSIEPGMRITLPAPDVSGEYDATPMGAVATLADLATAGLTDADPAGYATVYRQRALPGAPAPETAGLHRMLTAFRSSAGLAATGPLPELTGSLEITHAQVKGSTDGGRYVVACVLGTFTAESHGHALQRGIGDCQALRWSGHNWRISPGPLPAPAPSAWPGSQSSLQAGYREVTRR